MTKHSIQTALILAFLACSAAGCSVDPVSQSRFNEAAVQSHCSTVTSSTKDSTVKCGDSCTLQFKTLNDSRDAKFEFDSAVEKFTNENGIRKECRNDNCSYTETTSSTSTNLPLRHFLKLEARSGRALYVHQVDNTIFEFSGSSKCLSEAKDVAGKIGY